MNQDYPAKSRYQDTNAKNYQKKRINSFKWQNEQRIIGKIIKNVQKGSSILDVPIGTGRFFEYYVKGSHTVYGFDISQDMLSEALKHQNQLIERNYMVLMQGDVEYLPFCDDAVDYVVCTRLLNWMPLSVFTKAISELNRVARKRIIVEVRVHKPLGLLGIIRSFSLEIIQKPRKTIARIIRSLYIRVMSWFISDATGFSYRGYHPSENNVYGYILHNEQDVIKCFNKLELEIVDMIIVDQITICSPRESQPLLMYVLNVNK